MRAVANEKILANGRGGRRETEWLGWLFWLGVVGLFGVGVWLRLHDLGLPFDRDSYDEGVYWQTLRAMSAGHSLYGQAFYSQPPMFLLSVFPVYALFGQTLWAARLGIVLMSLLGLVGALLLGWALRGRLGALAALLLLMANPLYLAQSQTLQAEAPSIALATLAVGLACWWWRRPQGIAGMGLAVLTTVALALSIMSKLFGLAAVVPVGLLALARVWQVWRLERGRRLRGMASLLVGCAAFIVVCGLGLLPFVGVWPQLWQQVVSFHVAAGAAFKYTQGKNLGLIGGGLAALLSLAALYGTVVAGWQRDWRVLPLLGWLVASLYLLWTQIPLFPHHLVILVPSLIGLAVMGITPGLSLSRGGPSASPAFVPPKAAQEKKKEKFSGDTPDPARGRLVSRTLATVVALLLVLVTAGLNLRDARAYLRMAHGQGMAAETSPSVQVVKDLQAVTRPDQLVITDAQFLAALADRSAPPALVDTSTVHIQSGYLTAQELIREAGRPGVQAILFYTGRLRTPQLAAFDQWVGQHYRLVHDYGGGNGLWVKV